MTDRSAAPSRYQPPHGLLELTLEQARVFADPTRDEIMRLLAERPATTTQLAETMRRPRGSVGYHLKVLEEAGLIRVVRTRKVRALTEKYYGRLARTYQFPHLGGESEQALFWGKALAEARPPGEGETGYTTLRHARIPEERVEEFAIHLNALAEEFAAAERGGDTVYGLLIGVYPTDRPSLAPDEEHGR